MPRLTLLGAAGTVTGSKVLLETDTTRTLIDCGLFQGLKNLRLQNWTPLPVPAAAIDTVLLTHAHIDHSGYLPRLVREGFKGRAWCTQATLELCRLLLPDSGHLQEEDAAYANRKGFSKHHPALPLYTEAEARLALAQLRAVKPGRVLQLGGGREALFTPSGHILGAASVSLKVDGLTVLCSGDLGRDDDLLMRPPSSPPAADVVLIESTYGDRTHPRTDPQALLGDLIKRTVARGGSVLIPAFAVGRAQLLLVMIARLKAEQAIPDVPVFLNSPMAVDTTALYRRFPESHRLDAAGLAALSQGATMVRDVAASKALVELGYPSLIIAASGMATGGRVLHHLKALAPDPRNSIVLAGYQAAGTRGAALQAGARSLRIHGADHPVRAEVITLPGLSAHADADGLLRWARALPRPPARAIVVHGEPPAAAALSARLHQELGWRTEVGRQGEPIDLD